MLTASQVVQKIGLCVTLYDILWTSEGLIGHGTGLVNVNGMIEKRRVRY
jgi:DNA-directed RNA polymerase III subunit RPC8